MNRSRRVMYLILLMLFVSGAVLFLILGYNFSVDSYATPVSDLPTAFWIDNAVALMLAVVAFLIWQYGLALAWSFQRFRGLGFLLCGLAILLVARPLEDERMGNTVLVGWLAVFLILIGVADLVAGAIRRPSPSRGS